MGSSGNIGTSTQSASGAPNQGSWSVQYPSPAGPAKAPTASSTNWSSVAGAASAGQAFGSLVNSYSTSQAQKQEADFKKQQFEANAKIATMQAQDALRIGDQTAEQAVGKTNRMLGSQKVAAASQGIETNSGSAALVESDTKTLGALDALTIKNNAWKQAWGYQEQALQSDASGTFSEIAGQNQSNNTLMTGGMNAIGQGGQAAFYFGGGSLRDNKPTTTVAS